MKPLTWMTFKNISPIYILKRWHRRACWRTLLRELSEIHSFHNLGCIMVSQYLRKAAPYLSKGCGWVALRATEWSDPLHLHTGEALTSHHHNAQPTKGSIKSRVEHITDKVFRRCCTSVILMLLSNLISLIQNVNKLGLCAKWRLNSRAWHNVKRWSEARNRMHYWWWVKGEDKRSTTHICARRRPTVF